jgi:hypothetical protein
VATMRDCHFTDSFRDFLYERVQEEREDYSLARELLCARYDVSDPKAKDYFDMRAYDGSARISYTTAERFDRALARGAILRSHFDQGSHRVMVRPAAGAQEIASLDSTRNWGRALDVFAAACNAAVAPGPPVQIVGGAEIVRRYNGTNHCRCVSVGDLASSCMRYPDFGPRFKFYEDHARMAVVVCPACNGTRGRSLLWTGVNGERYFDRIYGSQTTHEQIRAWAKEHGYESVWPRGGYDRNDGVRVVVPAPNPDGGYPDGAPYLDSLMYWCRTCGTLSNRECVRGHDKVQLRSTRPFDHRGWWGICPRCSNFYHDERRVCQNARSCPGCGQDSCGDCPNECWACAACATINSRDRTTCREGCIRCECGFVSRTRWLSAMHGRCRNCSVVLQESVIHDVELTQMAGGFRGSCPECGHSCRMTSGAILSPRGEPGMNLISCDAIHPGIPSVPNCYHCPSCHTSMRWSNVEAIQRQARERQAQAASAWVMPDYEGLSPVDQFRLRTERVEAEYRRRLEARRMERGE